MVGDRNEDVMAAKGAGVPSIGVAASAHSTEQLKSHGALLTFNSFDDFYENIHKDFDLIRRLGF
jgi:phosphoglycolate phosphatase-like HAD superfamily hydrolase